MHLTNNVFCAKIARVGYQALLLFEENPVKLTIIVVAIIMLSSLQTAVACTKKRVIWEETTTYDHNGYRTETHTLRIGISNRGGRGGHRSSCEDRRKHLERGRLHGQDRRSFRREIRRWIQDCDSRGIRRSRR